MSWADKELKKHKIRKMVDEAMKTEKYKKARDEDNRQAVIRAYCRFCLIACDYLQIKHNYKKNGIINFLKYASEVIDYTSEEDEKYFEDMNQVMIDECGVDVLETIGIEVRKGDTNEQI